MSKRDKGDKIYGKKEAGDVLRVVDTKRRFLETLALENVCGIVSLACQVSRISRSYIYRLRENDPEFSKDWDIAIQTTRSYIADLAEIKLLELIKAGNVTAVIFGLKKYNPEEFGNNIGIKSNSPEPTCYISAEYAAMLRRLKQENKLVGQNKEVWDKVEKGEVVESDPRFNRS